MILLLLRSTSESQNQAKPPEQPATGPGGAEAKFAVRESSSGDGGEQYWIFEPEPLNGSVPVIAFLHGWNASDPRPYKLWIEHIVQRGNIVIYPRYQEGARERIPNMTPNAIAGLKGALSKLGNRADRSKYALVGHSLGGVMVFNLAAQVASADLPPAKALMAVAPGDTDATAALAGRARLLREGARYEHIHRDTLALVIVGDEDKVVADRTGRLLFAALGHVPCDNKEFVLVRSDRHGKPPLIADHFAPLAMAPGDAQASRSRRGPLRRLRQARRGDRPEQKRGAVDALDFYAYWKLFDALTDAAFYGRNRDYALGGGYNQTYMGKWSSGKPVEPLQVSNDPACGDPRAADPHHSPASVMPALTSPQAVH